MLDIENVACPDCLFGVPIPVAWQCPNCNLITDDRLPDIDQDNIVEVHNAWTVYIRDADDKAIAIQSRPQDWGHPDWIYHRFRFEWIDDKHYVNHAHCWTKVRMESYQYPTLFSGAIVQVIMPGLPPQLCGRDFLAEYDIWADDWGAPPPTFIPYEEE